MVRAASWVILAVGTLVCAATIASAQQTASTTETKAFEVIAVDGNLLVVRLPEGTREISVPAGFLFTVDGKQLSVGQLKPGMKGTATITTKTTVTPVTVTEVKNGTVMQASGANLVVRTDEGIRMFGPGELDKRGVKIMRDGQPANIGDLRQGDRLTAVIVTSMPPRVVTEKEVQATLAKAGAPAASAGTTGAAGAKPAAAQSASAGQSGAAASGRTLPATASPLPFLGVAGLGSLVAAIVARRRRLSR